MDDDPPRFDRQKPLSFEPPVTHPGLGSEATSQVPRFFAAPCHGNGRRRLGANHQQFAHFGAGTAEPDDYGMLVVSHITMLSAKHCARVSSPAA